MHTHQPFHHDASFLHVYWTLSIFRMRMTLDVGGSAYENRYHDLLGGVTVTSSPEEAPSADVQAAS